jgi:hypothetical protein
MMTGMKLVQKVEFLAGTDIADAVRDALVYSEENDVVVEFSFNGIEMNVARLDRDFRKDHELYMSQFARKVDSKNKETEASNKPSE